ncbi:phospholipase D-like domain-containing protein [Elusimicrobiota bacterium]
MNGFKRMLSIIAAVLIFGIQARAAFEVPGFELAVTIPVETELSHADVRPALDVWVEMFASSKESLDLAFFYCSPKKGESIDKVFDELRKAGERGVRVRVLLEKKFEKVSKDGIALLKTFPNLELRIFNVSKMKRDGILHAKYFLVDGKGAFVGSQNLDWRSLTHIHELGLKITDSGVVKDLAAVFEHDWKAAELIAAGKKVKGINRRRPKAPADRRAYLVASPYKFNPKGIADSETTLTRLLARAENDIEIQLLDYKPLTRKKRFYSPIDNALRLAATRGVKIKLLVSHWNTKAPYIDHLKSLHVIPNIEVHVATIPEAKQGPIPFSRVLHSKTLVIDGKTLWLGTSNWSGGYLDNSRNVEVVVNDEALAAKVHELYSDLWNSRYTEPIDVMKEYPKPRK